MMNEGLLANLPVSVETLAKYANVLDSNLNGLDLFEDTRARILKRQVSPPELTVMHGCLDFAFAFSWSFSNKSLIMSRPRYTSQCRNGPHFLLFTRHLMRSEFAARYMPRLVQRFRSNTGAYNSSMVMLNAIGFT
jgi:hypothetical protein